jgi:hypothetical protein
VNADVSGSADNEGAVGNVLDTFPKDKVSNRSNVIGEIKETADVLGIPRDRWSCQDFAVTTGPSLPVNRVRIQQRSVRLNVAC